MEKTSNSEMEQSTTSTKPMYYLLALVLLVGITSAWVLANLDVGMLWQDEGETACVSRTVLTEGIPKGTDGINFYSQQEGREYGVNHEWKLHPWFQFYWLAIFLALFESTTFVARFPFALLGIGTVILGFLLARRLWKDEKTAWLVAIAFLLNVMFLLLVRQARYYAPVMFFALYATWGLLDILERKKIGFVHYILGSLLFFQSQYLFTLNFWIASLIYTGLFYKDRLKEVGGAIAIAALPSIPFLIWILDTPYGETLTQSASSEGLAYGLKRFGTAFFDGIMEPIWLMALVPLFFLKDNLKKWSITKESERILVFFLLMIVGNIVAIALLVPEYYIRYLCVTIPFALLLKGRIGGWLANIHIAIPVVVLLAVAAYKGDVANYWKEVKNESFIGPMESMVNFIQKEVDPSSKVAISFGDLPLKYYLPNYKIYGGLAGDLPENLDDMDVIVVRRNSIDKMDQKVQIRLYEYIQANSDKFQPYTLKVEDTPFQNRETLTEHYYETVPVTNPLVLYKRNQ